jgi:hypothetical protein
MIMLGIRTISWPISRERPSTRRCRRARPALDALVRSWPSTLITRWVGCGGESSILEAFVDVLLEDETVARRVRARLEEKLGPDPGVA